MLCSLQAKHCLVVWLGLSRTIFIVWIRLKAQSFCTSLVSWFQLGFTHPKLLPQGWVTLAGRVSAALGWPCLCLMRLLVPTLCWRVPEGTHCRLFLQLMLLLQEHRGWSPKFFQQSKDLHEMWQVYRTTYQQGSGKGVGTSRNMTERKGRIKTAITPAREGNKRYGNVEIYWGRQMLGEQMVYLGQQNHAS